MRTETHPTLVTDQGTAADPNVIDHFHASARLYRSWSAEGHLHFGYWRWPIAPWNRRAMLEELVHQVVRPLQPKVAARLADLGCGYGSAARLIATYYQLHVDAFTIVPEQVYEGNRCAQAQQCADLVDMHLCDMRRTGLPDESMDGVLGIESWCYGEATDKVDVISEAARILRPGARISMVDGFIMKEPGPVRGHLLRTVEEGWAVPCFPRLKPFLAALERNGFQNIQVKDLSMRVGICALHGPPLMLLTLIRQLANKEQLDALEWAHLRSCMLGILMGTQHDLFRYLRITAKKKMIQPNCNMS